MAYTTIDKSTAHFNTKLYTGNGGTQSITGVGFQPNWVWIKNRSATENHFLQDAVRGSTKRLNSNNTNAEANEADGVTAFASDGFNLGYTTEVNGNGNNIVAWNWLAGGTAPAITYVVKVVSDSGNKYRFDDFGTSAVTLDLQEGGTYTFDQSDSSNATHPLRFYTASDKTGGEYTTGVTTTGTPGSSGAKTVITVAASAPTLYYQCSSHSGMGGQANTNSTFGSSNFSGSIQSIVSANTTSGFSIVKYNGTGGNATVGHGLGVAPKMIIVKNLDNGSGYEWIIGHSDLDTNETGFSDNWYFNGFGSGAKNQNATASWNSTSPTTSVFSLHSSATYMNASGESNIAYCFAEKTGFSKFGKYAGNGNADGPFVYTGFKPAWLLLKRSDSSDSWFMYDNKRSSFNVVDDYLTASGSGAEASSSAVNLDLLSNGFKVRNTDGGHNNSSGTYIYMAFGQSLVGSNNIPATAR